jgi:hypothetical protein
MPRPTSRTPLIALLLILALSLLSSVATAGRPAQPLNPDLSQGPALAQEPEVVTKVVSPEEQRAALTFWSRDAIAAAQPMVLPVDLGLAEIDPSAAMSKNEVLGPPGFVSAGTAAPGAEKEAQAAYPLDWAMLEEQAETEALGPTGTSQVYTSYVVNQASALQNLYPHRWIGRLSFTTPTGTSYCSGTSISGNVMLTAAHCLYDSTNNRWYSNWVFAPAYRNGSAPFGTFVATQCWVLTAWVNLSGSYAINSWAQHDVGVCKMGTNSSGTTLNNAVGWMGRQWNWGYNRHFHDLGYPFRDYNNNLLSNAGLYLRTCVAESFQQTTETRGMGCNLGGGISGGPWMVNYAVNVVGGNADGVNSGIFVGTQNIYGARFNSNNIVPLCTSAAC